MLIVDSREKQWKHIKKYLDSNNIPYQVKKLDVGDYFNTNNPIVVIDRKANLQEVCSNLMTGKENFHRFAKECRRARDLKIRFIVLIEGTDCNSISDVKQWRSKYSKHTGEWLAKQMVNLFYAYKVEWMFCKKNQTAKIICEILNCRGGNNGK